MTTAASNSAARSRGLHPSFADRVPLAYAAKHRIAIVSGDEGHDVLLHNNASALVIENCRRFWRTPLDARSSDGNAIDALLSDSPRRATTQSPMWPAVERLASEQREGWAVDAVDALLAEALRLGASDVHVQPEADAVAIRIRVDGLLQPARRFPNACRDELIGRLKVLGRLDVAERRLAQDGRASVRILGRDVDLRIASLPSAYGERIAIRLLDRRAGLLRLADLGMDSTLRNDLLALLERDHGLLVVTGPTGSGKTSTLYALLQTLDLQSLNVITIEDPIEFQIAGASQVQVNDKKGMTFATAMRHVLRQDPDVILVGEIRDRETAAMAVQAALTGHLVLGTLHANHAVAAIDRLIDLGVDPCLLSGALLGSLAQRLVRRACPECHAEELSTLCPDCRGAGYRGRCGAFELLRVTPEIRRAIHDRASSDAIATFARSSGMQTVEEAARQLVADGTTTELEVRRALAGVSE
jgi:general secretion pathway protein E